MIVRFGFVLIALCLAVAASADIKIIARAVETSTAFMTVPVTNNSRMTFRFCDAYTVTMNALWRQHDA